MFYGTASVLLLIMLLRHVLNPNPPGATLAPLRNFFTAKTKWPPLEIHLLLKKTTLVSIMGGYLGKIATVCAELHQFYIISLL